MGKAIFIASNGQNVGKTTSCLGILSGLRKRLKSVGFMKPVGQEHVQRSGGEFVDKDVHLFKEHFQLEDPAEVMSPVLFPQGFTRDYLDGKIKHSELVASIKRSHSEISQRHDSLLIEGTGHVGVGSIAELDNAKVASLLGVDVVIILSGGLGSSFDAFALNKQMCDAHGVKIRGVILNRVIDSKRDMILTYMQKALDRFNIPIIGCIPYDSFLSNPTFGDFESLLKGEYISGRKHRTRHFADIRLIATSVEVFRKIVQPGMLVITPATREDIIKATLEMHWTMQIKDPNSQSNFGMILTGHTPPSYAIIDEMRKSDIPMIYASVNSYEAMRLIHSHTCKIRLEDKEKIAEAIDLVESHVDFDTLIDLMN